MRTATSLRKMSSAESVLNFAHYLVDYYASDLHEFRVLLTKGDCLYDWCHGKALIIWRPTEELYALLHEIAHHRLKHRTYDDDDGRYMKREAAAWLWAERRARMHGVKFDYVEIDRTINWQLRSALWGKKRGSLNFSIDWRFKDGRKEARTPKVLRDPDGGGGSP